jgi:hypothetical protein
MTRMDGRPGGQAPDEAFLGELQRVSRPSPGRLGAAPWSERGGGAMAELQMDVMGGGATGGTDSNPKAW